jgi:cellulose synthase/poly-beta-1,6-N-acetylglucosamine synthase-like glycosyltransferase
VGGYPEQKQGNKEAGEDTLFDLKLKEKGFKFAMARDALIHWEVRSTVKDFCKQFIRYGRGDGKAGNLKKIPLHLISFIGLNIYLVLILFYLFFQPLISLILVGGIIMFFILQGIRYSIKKKRAGALIYIPYLLALKRFCYFIGVWKGL